MKANTLGNFLYYRRRELTMTKKELASKVGVSLRTISNWENDHSYRKPKLSSLYKLSMILNVSIDDMLF